MGFGFRVGGRDTIVLSSTTGEIVSNATKPTGAHDEFDVSWSRKPLSSRYTYSADPTPGGKNMITPPPCKVG